MTQERLNALLVLEKGGYAFDLTPGGNIVFHYAWPDEPPAVWADPLLALLREERDAAEAWVMTRAAMLLSRLRAARVRSGLFQM